MRRLGCIFGCFFRSLNESPSQKEGKSDDGAHGFSNLFLSLNESPSQKEGKYSPLRIRLASQKPSMKVPPKRKGNRHF